MRAWADRILRALLGQSTERQTDWRALAGEHCERANDLGASYSGAVAIIDGRDAMIRRLAGELRDLEMLWRAAGAVVAILQADITHLEELEKGWIQAHNEWKDSAAAAKAELATAREERDVYKRAADDLLDVAHRAHGKAREIAYGLNRPETTEGPDETYEADDFRSDICDALGECTACLPAGPTWAATDGGVVQYIRDIVAVVQAGRPSDPPSMDIPLIPEEAPTPPTLTPFEEFAARVRAAGLTPHNVATNWHWQIRDGLWIINVYPNTINGFWMQRQNENGKPGTVEEAIAMANEVPF